MNTTFDLLKSVSLSLATLLGVSLAQAQVPVRIMPLGDSLTQGFVVPATITGGYREELYSLLTAPGEGFTVDFVGTQNYPEAVVEDWQDGDHEAHGGFKIADVRREMGYWFKKVPNPDVILLHIGTNDFWAGGDAITAQQDLRDLLADMSTLLPHARIIVSSLNPRGDAIETVQEEFNQALPGIVAAQVALGRKVTFVDMHDEFGTDPGDLSSDLVHPSPSGYDKMATIWLPAIKSVITPLGTTAPPAIASVESRAGLQQVTVTFSKPINDADGTNPALFTLNEQSPPNASVSISQASLDASKRVVTLDTGLQTAGAIYALSVSGVRDRLVAENTIVPATATFVSRPFVDGSFEQNDVAWVKAGNVIVQDSTTQSASDGQNLVVFSDADSANDGKISQSIPTVPGQKYRLQFDMGVYASNFSEQRLQLTVRDDVGGPAGQLLLAPAPVTLNGGGSVGTPVTTWKLHAFVFTAISASTTISFEDVSTETLSTDLLLDDVRLYALFNELPVAVNDGGIGTPFLTVDENSGASPPITVLNNDSDANGDPLTVTAAASPNGTVVINGGETLSFTPTPGFSGEATISYAISDGQGGTAGATAWVLVTAAGPFANGSFEDGPPVDFGVPSVWAVTGAVVSYSSQGFYLAKPANGSWMTIFNPGGNAPLGRISQSFVTTIGQKYAVAFDAGLAAGVGNKSQPLSASVSGDITPPEQATSWSITSAAEPAEWAEPGKSFTFTATNTTTTLTFTVDISSAGTEAENVDLVLDNVSVTEVNETNQPPVAVADTYSTTVNVPLNVVLPGVLANDTDDGPSALAAIVDSNPDSGGTLLLNPDGSFTYTPLAEFIGVETFSYHASDGLLSSPVVTVSITVNPAGSFVNGSFENDTVIFEAPLGWTADGAVSYANEVNYIPDAGNGDWMVVFNPGGDLPAVSTLSQTFATVAGQEYTVTFDAGLAGGVGNKLQVLQADVIGETNPPVPARDWDIESSGPAATWTENTFNFIAGSVSTTLIFRVDISAGGDALDVDLVLDDVRVTPYYGPPQAPVAVDDGSLGAPFVTVVEDSGASAGIAVLANDSDPNFDVLTITAASSPNGTVVIDAGTTLIFTPALNFNGATTISYTISDGQEGTASATVFVAVTPVNDAPVAVNDGSLGSPIVTVAEDSAASAPILVLANDTDVELNPLTVIAANSPDGTVAFDAETSLSFTPALNFNGETTISYTISDGQGGTASATVFVAVTPVNDAPVAVNDGSVESPFVTVAEDSGASAPIAVLANDTDIDVDPLTVTLANSPNGTVAIIAETTLSFTPAENFNGPTFIAYTISDGQGGTSSATAFVTVTPVNDAPVAVNDGSEGSPFATVEEDSGASAPMVVLANDTDVDLDPLTVTLASSPNGTVAIIAETTLSFTPAENFYGATTISYTISDGQGGTASATVFVEVTPVNDAPVAANEGSFESPFVTIDEDSGASAPIVVLGNDSDVDLNPLTVTAASSLNGTVVIDAETTLSFTPALDFNGVTTISYTISDGQGGTASATVFVAVTPVNDAPVAVNDGSLGSPFVTVAEDSEVSAPILVLANDTDVDLDLLTVTAANSPDGTVAFDAGTSLSFTPALDFYGETTIYYSISDGQGGTASATVFVAVTPVNDAPVAVNDGSVESPFVTVAEDSGASGPIAVLANDTDVELDPLTVTLASSPNGTVAIIAETTLSFTPAENFHGATNIAYTISDGQGGTSSATVFVAVTSVNDLPVAVNDGSIESPFVALDEDSGASAPLTVLGNDTDADLDELVVTSASSPNGTVAIISETTLSFTPAENFNGATTISYSISDGQGGTASATVFVAVTPVNDAPVAVDDGSVGSPFVTVAEDSDVSAPILVLANDTDVELDSLTVTAAASPGGTVVIDAGTSLSFTPALNFNGETTISYTISDGQGGTSSATVFVAVTPVNDAPVAVNDGSVESPFVTVAEDSGASGPIAVLTNDTDIDLDALIVILASSPNGDVAIDSGTTLSFTPAENFQGAATISYTISDGQGGTASATVFVAVTSVNDVPVAVNDGSVESPFITIDEDSGASPPIAVLGNDTDADFDALTVTDASSPNGSVAIDSGTTLSFTPAENFNGATVISYTIADGQGGTASATVFIAVTPVNDAPVAVAGVATVNEDESVNINLVASDVDAGDVLTYEVVSDPANGSVSIVGSVATYVPNPNYHGSDSFTFKVTDSGLFSSAETGVAITVVSVNDSPVADDQSVSVDEDGSVMITLTGSDDDAPSLSFAVLGGPSHGSLRMNGAVATYTPDPDYNGPDSFYFIALTFNGGPPVSAIATVSITVNPINDAPAAIAQSVSLNEDGSLEITLAGSDPDLSDTLLFTPGTPANGSLTQDGAVVTYTPNPNYSGLDSFTFTVDDGTVVSPPATVSITVNPVNDPPVAVDDGSVESPFLTIIEDSENPLPIAVLANDSDADLDPLVVTLASSPDGSVVINPDGTVVFTPTLDFNGATTISYTISDGQGEFASATAFVSVTPVNDAPVAIAQALSMDEDGSLNITLSGSDLDGDITAEELIYTVTVDPSHGLLEVNGRNLVYTPNSNFNGGDSITFKVNDGGLDSTTALVSIVVSPVNDAPVAVNDGSLETPVLTIAEDSVISTPITVLGNDSDVDLDPLTVILAGSSDGLVTVNLDGTLSFTPALNFNGTAEISYTISDGQGGTATAIAFVAVTAVNDLPVAVDDGNVGNPFVTMDEDSTSAPIAVLANDTDVDPDTLTVTSAESPNGVVTINEGTTLSFAPASDFNGATTISYTVSDGQGGNAEATAHVFVTPVNDLPVAIAASATVNEDGSVNIILTGSDVDADEVLIFSKATDPANGSVTVVDGVATYVPNLDFNGPDSFTFKVNDGDADSLPATVSVTVTPVDDLPLANAQSVSVNEDGSVMITLTGSDVDGDSLTFTVVAPPEHGEVSLSGAVVTYTPDPDYFGADSFDFYAITLPEGAPVLSVPATVSITVTPVSDVPVAVDDGSVESPFLTVAEDSGASVPIAVLANDTDADLDPLTVTLVDSPDGAVAVNPDGTLTFTPTLDFNGATTISYTISDGNGGTSGATVYLSVTPVNDAPLAIAQAVSLDEDGSLAITLSGSDPDGDVTAEDLIYAVTINPLHGTLGVSGRNLVYTPFPDYTGADSITFTVNDGVVDSATAAVSVTVNPVNDAPTALAGSATVSEDGSVNITLTGGDVDAGEVLTFTKVTDPANGSVDVVNGVATYIPNPNYNGPDSFTFKVNDGDVDSLPATVSITVTPVDDAPVANAQSVSVNEDGSLMITLTGSDVDGDALFYTIPGKPPHGNVVLSGAVATYTPDSNYNGPDSINFFVYTIVSGTPVFSPSALVSVTVNPVNDAPVAVNDGGIESPFVTVAEDSGASGPIAVLANDVDVDATSLSVVTATSSNGTVAISDGTTLSFSPATNFNGAATISYTISDGQIESAVATVFVMVTPVNDAPVAVNDGSAESTFVTVAEDSGASAPIMVLGNDTDLDLDVLTVTLASSPNGEVAIDSGTTLSFTPDENFNGATIISYTISDGQGETASATVFITVTPINDAPVAFAQSIIVDEDTPVEITLTGSDIDGDDLTFQVGTASHGTVSLAGSVVTYTPSANYSGPDSFTFVANDGNVLSAPATVSITVNEVGGDAFTEWLTLYSLTSDPGTDSDNDSISNAVEYVIGGNPATQSNNDLLPTVELLDGNPGDEDYLVFTYRRTDLARDDPFTAINVEWSTDLTGPWSDASAMVEQVTDGDGVDLVKVFIPRSLASGGRLFTRLGVEISTVPASE